MNNNLNNNLEYKFPWPFNLKTKIELKKQDSTICYHQEINIISKDIQKLGVKSQKPTSQTEGSCEQAGTAIPQVTNQRELEGMKESPHSNKRNNQGDTAVVAIYALSLEATNFM